MKTQATTAVLLRFGVILFSLLAIIASLKFTLTLFDVSGLMEYVSRSILWLLCSFAPLIAVVLTSRESVTVLVARYNLAFKKVNIQKMLLYVLLPLVALPLTTFLVVYALGDLAQLINARITSSTLPIALSIFFTPGYLLTCLQYLIVAIGGEFAWRGFLGDTIKSSSLRKYIIIGAMWWFWSLMSVLPYGGEILCIDFIVGQLVKLTFFIVLSYYLANAVKSSKTLWTSACVVGLLPGTGLLYSGIINQNALIMGSESIITIVFFAAALWFINKIS